MSSLAQIAAAVAAAKPSGIDWTTIIVALGAAILGGGGGIATFLLLPSSRNKLDAETADVFTKAAVNLVNPMNQQLGALQHRVEELEAYKTTQTALLVTHAAWDAVAIAKLHEAGIDLPPIPPLHPPGVVLIAPAPAAS